MSMLSGYKNDMHDFDVSEHELLCLAREIGLPVLKALLERAKATAAIGRNVETVEEAAKVEALADAAVEKFDDVYNDWVAELAKKK